MAEPRTVVITGASRGLGFASAAHLYEQGWRVVAAMRSVDAGMERLREATGARRRTIARLIGVPLDLTDAASVAAAAKSIDEAVGAPYALGAQRRHLRGRHGRGGADEPVGAHVRHQHLRPGRADQGAAAVDAQRRAGAASCSCPARAGCAECPSTAPYSAVKGALERWGESMAGEVAPFGIGVTILVTGTYDTEIITDAGTTDNRDFDGPYARHHRTMDKRGRDAMKRARQVAGAVRRRTGQGAGGHGAVRPAVGRPRRADAVDRQPAAAGRGDAPR